MNDLIKEFLGDDGKFYGSYINEKLASDFKFHLERAISRHVWISVNDRLPSLRERVLLFDNGGFGALSGRRGVAGWYVEGDLDKDSNITHWMPLPEPPND